MAEAPFDGIYGSTWRRLRVERLDDLGDVDGVVDLLGAVPGPAGIAVVDLPDGSSWIVDFADPESLVSLTIPGGSIADSPVAVAMFGAEGAMFLADPEAAAALRDDQPDEYDMARKPSKRAARMLGRTRPPRGGEPSSIAGLVVLLADEAGDDDADPLVRLAAIAELVRVLPNMPGSSLVDPLVPSYLAQIEQLAAGALEAGTFEGLTGASADELRELLRSIVGRRKGGSVAGPAVRALIDQLEQPATWHGGVAAMVLPAAAPAAASAPDEWMDDQASGVPDADPHPDEPVAVEADEPEPVLTQLLEVERVGDMLIEVRMALTVYANWARVVRKRDLVTVALVPLEERTHLRVGRGVIPPDLSLDDIEVTFETRSHQADDVLGTDVDIDPDELMRTAIRLGRSASRAARSGDLVRARQLWGRCEAAWRALGDPTRARLANEYGQHAGGRLRRIGMPLLAETIHEELGLDEVP